MKLFEVPMVLTHPILDGFEDCPKTTPLRGRIRILGSLNGELRYIKTVKAENALTLVERLCVFYGKPYPQGNFPCGKTTVLTVGDTLTFEVGVPYKGGK